MPREITLILAYGPDGVLGNKGNLPWPPHHEDMRRFREVTLGATIIMGRKTYESIGRPLPWRSNVVLTSTPRLIEGEVEAVDTFERALKLAAGTPCFVMGGAAVYALAMPYATRILLTEMHGQFEGDVYFKIPFLHQWEEVSRDPWRGSDGHCDFVEYRPKAE